jgi:hypothetical protein
MNAVESTDNRLFDHLRGVRARLDISSARQAHHAERLAVLPNPLQHDGKPLHAFSVIQEAKRNAEREVAEGVTKNGPTPDPTEQAAAVDTFIELSLLDIRLMEWWKEQIREHHRRGQPFGPQDPESPLLLSPDSDDRTIRTAVDHYWYVASGQEREDLEKSELETLSGIEKQFGPHVRQLLDYDASALESAGQHL